MWTNASHQKNRATRKLPARTQLAATRANVMMDYMETVLCASVRIVIEPEWEVYDFHHHHQAN